MRVKGRILVVDGNVGYAENVVEVLAEFGYRADQVDNATDALEVAASYDCIVSEHTPPQVDALELIRSLRRRGSSVPVVILSARWDHRLHTRALSTGALLVLSKYGFEQWACALLNALERLRQPAIGFVVRRAEPESARRRQIDALSSAS